jgi:S1-C subfamily serine protease
MPSSASPPRSPRTSSARPPRRPAPAAASSSPRTATSSPTTTSIEDANSVKVTLYNGKEYDAKLVGTDSVNDVALLKIEATGLQAVTVGDSDKIEVGEQVVAIGNPLGELTFTMTQGYISATGREINTDGTPINMLQTDAAINSGNSGGPLFDMNGNVVGITTAKYSGTTSTGTSIEGIGFAIPINDVLKIVYDLQENGYVTGRAYLGISVRDLDELHRFQSYNLPVGPIRPERQHRQLLRDRRRPEGRHHHGIQRHQDQHLYRS